MHYWAEIQRALTRNDIIQQEAYKPSRKWGSSEQHFDHLVQVFGTLNIIHEMNMRNFHQMWNIFLPSEKRHSKTKQDILEFFPHWMTRCLSKHYVPGVDRGATTVVCKQSNRLTDERTNMMKTDYHVYVFTLNILEIGFNKTYIWPINYFCCKLVIFFHGTHRFKKEL